MRGTVEYAGRLAPLTGERGVPANGARHHEADFGWARSYGSHAERLGLRRGAWYRVVEDRERPWVVLDVNGIEVRVARVYLQFRGEPPGMWSVVRPGSEDVARGRRSSQPRLVCPGCHGRHLLRVHVVEMRCPDCGRVAPVDWGDPG